MTAVDLPANITSAREASTAATSNFADMATGQATIGDILKQKTIDLYNNNQDIVGPLDTATQTYLQSPQVAREKYQDIFNPFTREKLVSQYVGNESMPMLSLSNIYGNRLGRIQDIIGAGTNAYTSAMTAEQAKAEQARQLYTDLLKEYVTSENLASQKQADDLAWQKFMYDQSSGDGDIYDQILMSYLGGGMGGTSVGGDMYESPPMTPSFAGQEMEWPQGSGVIWVSNNQGGWE